MATVTALPTAPRRKLAQIPRGNPLARVLQLELLNRVAARRKHGTEIVSVDYFCGAGGLTTGIDRAKDALGITGPHYGINHDENAIQTISSNHFGTFINSTVESIPLRDIVREGYVTLFAGAAECIMFSSARGSDKEIYDQSRTSAAYMLQAIHDLPPEAIILENVVEWMRWGRLCSRTKRPLPGYEGEYYRAFMRALEKMGYDIEARKMNAADYGAYTSRERLIVCGVISGRPLLWPVQTNAKDPAKHKGQQLDPWKPASDIIDWSDLGISIFANPKGPHAPKSLRRMATGYASQPARLASAYSAAIDRFIPISEAFHGTRAPKFEFTNEDVKRNPALKAYVGTIGKGKSAKPFTKAERIYISNVWRTLYGLPHEKQELRPKERKAILRLGIAQARAATRLAFARPVCEFTFEELLEPIDAFTVANRMNNVGHSVEDSPVQALTTAPGGGIGLVSSVMLGQHGGGIARDTQREPAPTIAGGGALSIGQPMIEAVCERSPLSETNNVTVEPLLVTMNHGGGENSRVTVPKHPLLAQTGKGSVGLAQPFISRMNGCYGNPEYSVQDPQQPMSPITGVGHHALVTPAEPFIARMQGYFGDDRGSERITDPVSSVAAGGNHHALVTATDPFIIPQQSYDRMDTRSTNQPIPSPTQLARVGLVQSHLVKYYGDKNGKPRCSSEIQEPLPTAPTENRFGIANSMVLNRFGDHADRNHGSNRTADPDNEPLFTATKSGAGYIVNGMVGEQRPGLEPNDSLRPFINVRYHDGTVISYVIDVLFRMLKALELARAMGFVTKTHSYTFAGDSTSQVRQIGNAVECTLAEKVAFQQLRTVLHYAPDYANEAIAA